MEILLFSLCSHWGAWLLAQNPLPGEVGFSWGGWRALPIQWSPRGFIAPFHSQNTSNLRVTVCTWGDPKALLHIWLMICLNQKQGAREAPGTKYRSAVLRFLSGASGESQLISSLSENSAFSSHATPGSFPLVKVFLDPVPPSGYGHRNYHSHAFQHSSEPWFLWCMLEGFVKQGDVNCASRVAGLGPENVHL